MVGTKPSVPLKEVSVKRELTVFSNKFPASGVIFAVVPVLQEKNISVNTKCDLLSK